MARAWILQANPRTWDVFGWHDEGGAAAPLTRWTVAYHRLPIAAGDDFALWLSGREPGVYAIGKVSAAPSGPQVPTGRYWRQEPTQPSWSVGIEVTLARST